MHAVPEARVEAVRRFNRFYTQRIGVLREGLLDSPFSLAEARVLYELAHRRGVTASELARDLAMDAGYLSRILARFKRSGLVSRRTSSRDARARALALTRKGRAAFKPLEARARAEAGGLLAALGADAQRRVVEAMETIVAALDAGPSTPVSRALVLRAHRPGDIGWVIHRHGVLYAQEYGWDERFEALVAGIAAAFVRRFDPRRERCWIAELEGEIVGSVLLVRAGKTVARLRLLLVEPEARGEGVGTRLVDECVRFARVAGYRRIVLWTNGNLIAARHVYARAGFRKTREEAHESFGRRLVGETWELDLGRRPAR